MRRICFFLLIFPVFFSTARSEFQVNSRTGLDEENAALGTAGDGRFVVVWRSYSQDGDSGGIFGQRFDANGFRGGEEFQVNVTTEGNQEEADVAMNDSGEFVVVWEGPGVSEEEIFGRRYDANGSACSGEFQVNTYTDGRQLCPSVAMNNDGNFVVVWESENVAGQPVKRSICGRLYDSNGESLGSEFNVTDVCDISRWRFADAAMREDGEFVAVWIRDSSLKSVWVRHFDANGTAAYDKKRVNDGFNFTSLCEPAIAMDDAGNYAIVWDGNSESYLQDDVYLRLYHNSHAPLHSQFRVNTSEAGRQCNPDVRRNGKGEFVAVWQSDTYDELRQTDISGRRFAAHGEYYVGEPVPVGEEFQINRYAADEQERPAVGVFEGGGFAAVWDSEGQDGSGEGVFGELGPVAGFGDFDDDGFVAFGDFCFLANEWLKEGCSLQTDLIDDNKVDANDLEVFCGQWLLERYVCSEIDFYADGRIDFKDYAKWAGWRHKFGPGLDGDIDESGIVDLKDLMGMLYNWLEKCD